MLSGASLSIVASPFKQSSLHAPCGTLVWPLHSQCSYLVHNLLDWIHKVTNSSSSLQTPKQWWAQYVLLKRDLMLSTMSDRSIKSRDWRGKVKIYNNFLLVLLLWLSLLLTKSGSRRSHSLRKWKLSTMLGTEAYLTHTRLLLQLPNPYNPA